MLLFSIRALAEFTHDTLAVMRTPRDLRPELRSEYLRADGSRTEHHPSPNHRTSNHLAPSHLTPSHRTPYCDAGDQVSAELVLEWLCRAHDVSSSPGISAGYDPNGSCTGASIGTDSIHDHENGSGWFAPADRSTQCMALRAFLTASEFTGDRVYRARARRISELFMDQYPSGGPNGSVTNTAEPDAALDVHSIAQLSEEVLALVAACRALGLAYLRPLLHAASLLLPEPLSATPVRADLLPCVCVGIGLRLRALIAVALLTREAKYADAARAGLQLALAVERDRGVLGASSLIDRHNELPGLSLGALAQYLRALVDGWTLTAENRFLHEARSLARQLAAVVTPEGFITEGFQSDRPSTRSLRKGSAGTTVNFTTILWTADALWACAAFERNSTTRATLIASAQAILSFTRRNIVPSQIAELRGSIREGSPLHPTVTSLVRSTLVAATYLESQLRSLMNGGVSKPRRPSGPRASEDPAHGMSHYGSTPLSGPSPLRMLLDSVREQHESPKP